MTVKRALLEAVGATALLFTALMGVFSLAVGTAELHKKYFLKCEQLTITEIGGCNKWDCGVRYSDNSFGKEGQPVLGQEREVCR